MANSSYADRIAGTILFVLAVSYWWHASSYSVDFGDPGGPTLFPRIVSFPTAIFSLYLIFRPDRDQTWFAVPAIFRQIGLLVLLFGYPLVIEPLGFPAATFLAVMPMAMLFGARWLPAVITGLAMAVTLFILFDQIFGLPLPAGPFFS